MKNAIITGIMAATILLAGCEKKSPNSSATPSPAQATAPQSTPKAQSPERAIVTKARGILLPEFKLDDVTLAEALPQLAAAARQNDPESIGINFMINGTGTAATDPKISLALKNVTVEETTERLAKAAGVSVSARDYAFVFDPNSGKP